MEISRPIIGIAAALCVAAGAGGAYLATRGSEPTAATPVSETALISPDPSAPTVELSEAVVSDAPAASPEATAGRATLTSTPSRPRASRPQRAAAAIEAPPQQPVHRSNDVDTTPFEERTVLAPALEPAARVAEAEPPRAPEPPAPQFEELVIAEDAVVGLQVESPVSSEQARVEDEVVARVTRDVKVGDRVAIPAGSKAHGEVTLVERGGRMRERARLGIRFTSVVLADGTRIPMETETIYREGSSPTGESAAKIGGGAIGGAIIGGILGGAKGAAIGGSVGAGAGTAAVMAGGRNPATLPTGTPVTVRVVTPTTVTVEK